MKIERSQSQTEQGFANTSSIKHQMLSSFQASEEYRHAFIGEAIRTRLTAQIKTLRDHRAWNYKQFAEKIGKKVSWAYRLEDPNGPPPTIPSLLQVAVAFDVGLDVRFRSFSELLGDVATLTPKSFSVPSFDEELRTGAFLRGRRTRSVRKQRGKLQPKPIDRAKHSDGERAPEGPYRSHIVSAPPGSSAFA